MPTKRSDKLKRLVAVQRQLEQMAELDLADTARSRREVSETIDIVADAMGSAHPMHRLFSGQYAVQLDRLAQKDQMLANIQQAPRDARDARAGQGRPAGGKHARRSHG